MWNGPAPYARLEAYSRRKQPGLNIMPRAGRFLEILVEHLQRYLGPEGIEVRSPEVFSDGGRNLGEIDVTLRGDFGSSRLFVGIECRDRRSEGPQGLPWIREIHGKQRQFGIDKMIAVSTTGFTDDAKEFADEIGVDLLAIEDPDSLDLRDWFEAVETEWREGTYKITGPVDLKPAIRQERSFRISIEDRVFRKPEEQEAVSLSDLIKPEIQALMSPPTDREGELVEDAVIRVDGPIVLRWSGDEVLIDSVRVPVRLKVYVSRTKVLLNVCRRLSDNEVVALTGIGRLKRPNDEVKVLVLARRNRSDPSRIDLRHTLLDENDRPLPIPPGTTYTLFGRP